MPTVAEFLIEAVSRRVKHIFGIAGSYNIHLFDKLYKSNIEVVPTTTELSAGIAADAYARVSGMGCCCVTYCVGGFRLLDAIAGAYAEKSPVVVISGAPGVKERQGKMLLHHMVGNFECQHRMYEHVTCANTVLRDPDRAGYEIDRVLQAAEYHKQPVYIEVPRDIIDKPIHYDAYTLGTPQNDATDSQCLDEAIAEVTQWINQSKNPVIWAGVEVARYGLSKALLKLAENTNIPVATTILGKSVINESHPLALGVYCESTATDELKKIMESSDCLIMLGVMQTDMNFGFMPRKYPRRGTIVASSHSLDISNHSYNGVRLDDFVNGLVKARISKRELPRSLSRPQAQWNAEKDVKITVSRLFAKINSIITENTAIVSDIGDSLFGSLDMTIRESHNFICDAFYTSMGFSVPAALGVQTAKPNIRPVVIVGDGAMQMTGTEFSTMVHRKGYNPIVIVLNNRGYGTERVILDGPYNDIPDWSYEKLPLLVGGGAGFKVTTEEELESAMGQALECKTPSIINVVLDQRDHTPALKRMFSKMSK